MHWLVLKLWCKFRFQFRFPEGEFETEFETEFIDWLRWY
jgi:hypothetical protein